MKMGSNVCDGTCSGCRLGGSGTFVNDDIRPEEINPK